MTCLDRIRMRSTLATAVVFELSMLISAPVWGQAGEATRQQQVPGQVGLVNNSAANNTAIDTNPPDDRMMTPPPVSGQYYPTIPASAERSNYLRYGVSFTTAYTDNVLGASSGPARSDVSYSVAPDAALDVTTSRIHWQANYAPGFTFYQHTDARNEADHNAGIDFQYRLSPHATLSARDSFRKSSNVFNQQDLGSFGGVSGGIQGANSSVIVPIADQLSNSANIGFTHQFALNDMIGTSGTFTSLYYPNPAQVTGLYDSTSQAGSAFYSHRMAQVHYLGVTYEYQRLISRPAGSPSETQTHAAIFFYTFFPSKRFSLSFFGGPQYADTVQPTLTSAQSPLPELKSWSPQAGASLNWQGSLTAMSLSYSHMIAPGSGLVGAVYMDSGNLSLNRQFTRMFSGSVSGGYAQNNYVGSSSLGNNGHSIFGTAAVQRQLGERVNVQLGYTHIHQTYTGVQVLSLTPDTNRGFISISYQFSKALGR